MRESKVVSMCPKCSKIDTYPSSRSRRRYLDGQKYEIHTCPICGERYLAKTFGYHSILRFHGDDYMEQLESILEITPSHFDSFIQQLKDTNTEEQLLSVIHGMHGDVKPITTKEYEKMLDCSLILTEDLWEKIEMD
ncbi:MAG: hypothetical protein IIT46_15380 [Lachnospiraceae bacterium]|nr:hypothetical protein [Lachnospiraceae bacterium]